MKNSLVLHPFLFAVFPIFFLFSHNIEQTSFSEIYFPSAIMLGFTLLLIVLFGLILRNSKKAAIIVSFSLFLFFSYGHIYDLHEGIRHWYLLLSWGMLFVVGAYFIIKTNKKLSDFTNFLNIVAFSLIMISFINIGVYEFKTKSTMQDDKQSIKGRENNTTDLENASALRDIYYIILDGYASSDTLKEVYDYDNQNFIESLTKKGFFVPSKSRSNYALTYLSLASSLNMKYLDKLTDIVGLESDDRRIPYRMIENSDVMKFLKLKGYKFINFSSRWEATNYNRFADLNIDCGVGNEFQMILVQSTILSAFEKRFQIIKKDLRKRVLGTFSELAELHTIKEPIFVLAHIISPHPPYLFGSKGEPVPKSNLKMSGSVWEQKEDYTNQLFFINRKVETLVDEILSKTKNPPIIILQADHGTASTLGHKNSGKWENPTREMLRERTGIFNAYYLPIKEGHRLYNTITPVNTFRLIFNIFFDVDLELLNDQIYFSSYKQPYDFIDVTNRVK